jgi:hypothetical protein
MQSSTLLIMPDRPEPPSDSALDAAIRALNEPGRLGAAQDLVARAAPALQRVLAAAIAEGGWFDSAHEQAVREAVGGEDPHERIRLVRTLLAEETRLSMLVGVAIGFELSRELNGESPGGDSLASSPGGELDHPTPQED